MAALSLRDVGKRSGRVRKGRQFRSSDRAVQDEILQKGVCKQATPQIAYYFIIPKLGILSMNIVWRVHLTFPRNAPGSAAPATDARLAALVTQAQFPPHEGDGE
jgi:hypothetical protein